MIKINACDSKSQKALWPIKNRGQRKAPQQSHQNPWNSLSKVTSNLQSENEDNPSGSKRHMPTFKNQIESNKTPNYETKPRATHQQNFQKAQPIHMSKILKS